MRFAAALFAAIGTVVLAPASPATAQTAVSKSSWSDRVTISAEGGHVIGNPVAKFRLTEFMSYACPRCGNFERDSHASLRTDFVDRGHVSFEIRHAVLNGVDMAAALMARCGSHERFFDNHKALLENQIPMLRTFEGVYAKQREYLNQGTTNERLIKIAEAADLFTFMQGRGYSKSELTACLTNKQEQDILTAMTDDVVALVAPATAETPTFTLNGKFVGNVRDWAPLRAGLLRLPE